MAGMIMDAVLMLLLVAAVGYGIKLERKLATLRAGQVAFAQAVSELNTAAGRAEAALATLRASGQETDLLHDRIIKAREVKQQLESLIARAPVAQQVEAPAPARERDLEPAPSVGASTALVNDDEERARRMAALADRIQGMSKPAKTQDGAQRTAAPGGRDNVAAIVQALTAAGSANHTAKQSLNAARRNLDDDLFAA
ncbi:hypothetical protein GCM10017620_00470 [Brevundimonas intermedia]|uniref:DUF6468 domain-containing protein n=1 Tax=Brevundimonas intermedia TaxID=74315 RepID=A0ABQ5T2U6_9CAUL|nr:DUF6468 domain-containing protein [Brevundimonas intermedia]GLK47074.1 hypothetical protein GCM10017620_00470 [Brevundimonas intermedia]